MKIVTLTLLLAVCALAQQPVQLQTVNGGGAVLLGHGTASGSLRVELPTDGTGVVGLNAGSNNIGHVDGEGTAGTPSGGVVSIQGVSGGTAIPISGSFTPSATSTYALTKFHATTAAAANVKASAGNLYSLVVGNSGTIPCWLQLFNNASTPTAGTSVIDSIYVQAGVTVTIPPAIFAYQNFATGIAIAGATTDSGATTTGCTSTVSVSAYYQ
jgi:hypothetical protein